MMQNLASALLSPEVLPWITGSGGALVVLFLWVQAERSDKRDLRKECATWRDRDASRADTVVQLVREATGCIATITERVSNGDDAISDLLKTLQRTVADFRCNAATPTRKANEHKGDSSPIPRSLPESI